MRVARTQSAKREVVRHFKSAPCDGVCSFTFDQGLVLLDQRTGRLFAYNDSAAVVWRALEDSSRRDDAIAAISKVYGISADQASRDVSAIIEHWRAVGLIGSTPNPSRDNTEPVPALLDVHVGTSRHATYRLGGRFFRISVEDPDTAQRVEALLQSYREEWSGTGQTIEVCRCAGGDLILKLDGVETVRVNSSEEMTGAVFQALLSCIHSNNHWLAIIHGGAVAADGRGVLLPGRSGSGKSTLGAFLISRGFDYLSDDMTAVTPAGSIASWPIPISLKRGSWKALAPHLPQLEAIPSARVWKRTVKYLPVPSPSSDSQHCRANLLIFPRFHRSAQGSRLDALRPMEALQRLISDRIWLGYPLHAQSIQRFLNWLVQLRSYELSYGNFDTVEELVRGGLSRCNE